MDGLITVNTTYFIDDLDQALRELARILKNSARAVIGIGDPDAMEKKSFTAHGFRLRSAADIETALNRAGLTLIEHRRVGEGRIPAHLLVTTPRSPTPRADNGARSDAIERDALPLLATQTSRQTTEASHAGRRPTARANPPRTTIG